MQAVRRADSSSMAIISDKYDKLGMSVLHVRGGLILNICSSLADGSVAGADADVDVKALVGLWKQISQLNRGTLETEGMGFMVPSTKEMLKLMKNPKKLQDARQLPWKIRPFGAVFPQYFPGQVSNLLPALLATMAVLSDPALSSPEMHKEAAPLLNVVALAMDASRLELADIGPLFEKRKFASEAQMTELRAYVKERWPQTRALLRDEADSWGRVVPKTNPLKKGIANLQRQLRLAYTARNTGAIMSIWDKVITMHQESPEFADNLRKNGAELIDYAIFVWCAIRRREKLQETLDLMQQAGLQPTIKTYTAMMHGWKECKDSSRIEALWHKLVEAGFEMDVFIWTERISALIEAGQAQAGIQALGEMMGTWKEAYAADKETKAVKPTIEVINATLKGLLMVDPQAANEVLAWAGREGLEPDVRTYNITIKSSLKGHSNQDVLGILKTMKSQGIEPDAATFTIILEEVIGGLHNATAAEQVLAVGHTFADMEAAGIRPNVETYSKMLHAVSGLTNSSNAAIDAVQAHMQSRGLGLTPHMITILTERCVDQGGDVDAVLDAHNMTTVNDGDQTLWERVASAYARTNRPDDAMRVYRELARAGRPVTSLVCLKDLLETLVASGRWEDGAEVVKETIRYKTGERERDVRRYWKHHFWVLAIEHGLVSREEAPAALWEAMNADGR